ncbi:HAD family hydrolase [Castellaniella sp.]|uniref:HAD family hydrolase n=1 Tax=Castellaniella sp. TaxID=1955812 RepID=UPI00355F2D38
MNHLILFDFDGTLADTAPDLVATANRQRAYHGLPPLPDPALRPHASQGARGLLKAALGLEPQADTYEAARRRFLDDYAQIMLEQACLFAGIAELLDELEQHHLAWGIVTNKSEALARPIARHLGIEARSLVTVGGDTTPHIKPHPEPLLHAARQARIEPTRCIYIGDDERDVQAGKAAGMATVAAAYGYGTQNDPTRWQADAIAQTPDELWPIIRQWATKGAA